MTTVDIENGKYTIVIPDDGTPAEILRQGEKWTHAGMVLHQIPAGKAWIAAAHELKELREEVARLKRETAWEYGVVVRYPASKYDLATERWVASEKNEGGGFASFEEARRRAHTRIHRPEETYATIAGFTRRRKAGPWEPVEGGADD